MRRKVKRDFSGRLGFGGRVQDSHSYVCGTGEEPLRFRTVGGVLADAAARWPEREALVVRSQGVRMNYAELLRESDRLAHGLLAAGLEPGDRVGIWSPNRFEWLLVQFATARAGLVLVNINPAYRTTELAYALRKVACRALILAPAFKTSDYVEMVRELLPEATHSAAGLVHSAAFPALERLVVLGERQVPGFLSFPALRALGDERATEPLPDDAGLLDPDDDINIQFTSGTTGAPKGATLTHFNIVNNGLFVGRAMRFTHEDRLCIPVPLYHCFGMVMSVLTAVTHGAAMVFPGEGFDPLQVLEAVAAERCTALHGVPTMFIAELEHPRFHEFDLGSLRTGIMAGAPCPIQVMRRVIEQMHMREVTIAYGMTETSPVSFQSGTDDPLDKRVSTVGRIHPHVQVKIIDSEGRTVPRGVAGELCTRGYSVMRGYWDDEQRSREAIDAGGWMHTGDLATLDDEGYCQIVGRVKDMIIRGGENVYPREIEEYLFQHPKVQDVAVIGVPDERFGEEVCAVVRLRDGAQADGDEFREFCRGRIAHYKVPRYVVFADAFPMTVTGKVQKFVLRDAVARDLGLVPQSKSA